MKPWERQPGEPVKAYRPFLVYLNMGPRRSIDSAWALYIIEYSLQNSASQAPGSWTGWCRKFSWVSRVKAREDYLAQQEFEALENEMRELAVRRQRREVRRQTALEKMGEKFEAKIEKLLELPSVNVSSEKVDGEGRVVVNKVSAMRPGEIAKLSAEWRNLEATAIHGHVHVSKTIRVDDAAQSDSGGQGGTAEFIPGPPPETPTS